jgi:hypothetical protein
VVIGGVSVSKIGIILGVVGLLVLASAGTLFYLSVNSPDTILSLSETVGFDLSSLLPGVGNDVVSSEEEDDGLDLDDLDSLTVPEPDESGDLSSELGQMSEDEIDMILGGDVPLDDVESYLSQSSESEVESSEDVEVESEVEVGSSEEFGVGVGSDVVLASEELPRAAPSQQIGEGDEGDGVEINFGNEVTTSPVEQEVMELSSEPASIDDLLGTDSGGSSFGLTSQEVTSSEVVTSSEDGSNIVGVESEVQGEVQTGNPDLETGSDQSSGDNSTDSLSSLDEFFGNNPVDQLDLSMETTEAVSIEEVPIVQATEATVQVSEVQSVVGVSSPAYVPSPKTADPLGFFSITAVVLLVVSVVAKFFAKES